MTLTTSSSDARERATRVLTQQLALTEAQATAVLDDVARATGMHVTRVSAHIVAFVSLRGRI